MTDSALDAQRARSRARAALCDLLIEQIRRDQYPSAGMMYLVESQLTEEQLPAYLDMLLDKIAGDRYPSMDMVRRFVALARGPGARRSA